MRAALDAKMKCLAVTALLAGPFTWVGCQGVASIPPRVDPATAERLTWRGPDGVVSALRSGTPGARRVLFVHGTPGDATNWSPYLEAPLPGTEFLAVDRPGFGESEPEEAVPSLARQAAALAPVLAADARRRPVLVGHSLGGPVVLRAACESPDRIGGLLILAGNVSPALEELHWYNHLGRLVQPLLPRALENSNRELLDHRSELEELTGMLGRIRCPVVIVHGTEDGLVPFENAAYLRDALVGAESVRLLALEGENHFFIWTHPELVWSELRGLVAATGEEPGD